VLSEKQWKTEAVLFLGCGLMVSLALGMFVTLALRMFAPDTPVVEQRFINFLISNLSFQIVPIILIHYFLKQHELTWPEFLGLRGPNLHRALVLGLAVAAIALPLTLGLNELAKLIITWIDKAPDQQPTMKILESTVSIGQRIWFGATAILLAPLMEEIIFRAVAYRFLRQHGHPRLALFGTALLFGAIHGSAMTLVPLTVLAVILALLYEKTGNLAAPIFAHAVFNAVNFTMFLLAPKQI
jgi:membrane protease YdiL (CAAX protease family)